MHSAAKLKLSRHIRAGLGSTINAAQVADAFEALIAALFLDQGMSAAQRFCETHVFPRALQAWRAYQSSKPTRRLRALLHDWRSRPTFQCVRSWSSLVVVVLNLTPSDRDL